MNKNILIIVLFLLAAFSGCGISRSGADNGRSNQNINVKTDSREDGNPKTGKTETGAADKTETGALKDAISSAGDFKFKTPCASSEVKDDAKKQSAGTKTDTRICESNKVKLTVTSQKSNVDLTGEFENLKRKDTAREGEHNGIPFVEYTDWRTTVTKTETEGFPPSSEYDERITKNRVYLVNEKWTINFEASCKSAEKDYCGNIFADKNGTVSVFFESLQMLK